MILMIAGVSTGASCVVAPVFISEFAETSIRGMLGTCFQLFLTIGILLVYAVGAVTNWITLSWVCLTLPVALLAGLFFIPESPVWLLKNVSTKWTTLILLLSPARSLRRQNFHFPSLCAFVFLPQPGTSK